MYFFDTSKLFRRRNGIVLAMMALGIGGFSLASTGQAARFAADVPVESAEPEEDAAGMVGDPEPVTALQADADSGPGGDTAADPPSYPLVCCLDLGVCTLYGGECPEGTTQVDCPCKDS